AVSPAVNHQGTGSDLSSASALADQREGGAVHNRESSAATAVAISGDDRRRTGVTARGQAVRVDRGYIRVAARPRHASETGDCHGSECIGDCPVAEPAELPRSPTLQGAVLKEGAGVLGARRCGSGGGDAGDGR